MIIVLLLLLFPAQLRSQEAAAKNSLLNKINQPSFLEFGLEYYYPYHWNREIKTININGLIGKEFIQSIGLQLFAGATITHAWGNIIAVNEFHKEERFNTSTMGIGPVILFRVQPLTTGSFSFSVDAFGGIILYNKSFPPGGDIYNFMFRLGGTISFNVGDNYKINIGLRRMHISNGQGIGSFNPFYEANGISLNLDRHF
jgi:hypothetical protein